MLVLAVINLFVIIQGVFSFFARVKNYPVRYITIILFYSMALSCLIVAEVYLISGYIHLSNCAQAFIQTYPGMSYLLTAYCFIP